MSADGENVLFRKSATHPTATLVRSLSGEAATIQSCL